MAETKPRSRPVMVRVTPEAFEIMQTIALEEGMVGGIGRGPDEPNVSAVVRKALAKLDPRLAANDLSLEWERS